MKSYISTESITSNDFTYQYVYYIASTESKKVISDPTNRYEVNFPVLVAVMARAMLSMTERSPISFIP